MIDLLTALAQNPELAKNINLTVNAADLLHFAQTFTRPQAPTPPPAPPAVELMTIDEAADFLKVTRVTLWQWEKKKILHPLRIGNLTRYRKDDIIKALERRAKA